MATLINYKFGYAPSLWFTRLIVATELFYADVSRNTIYFNSKFVYDILFHFLINIVV